MRGFRMWPLGLLVLALVAGAGPSTLQAQQVTVRGSVVNEATGQPVEEASVVIVGTQLGTRTNAAGEFTLVVRSLTDTLRVTRIGYSAATVAIAGRSEVAVQLRAAALQLNEVVVVGYGTQRRSDITGSVASVDPERLTNSPNTNPVQALQGTIAGVNVTTSGAGAEQTLNIMVRGQNSISAATRPLVVIDGIPYEGGLSDINPGDIESLEVLKDASSTAIYGSRGSNGVILITTKRGATGTPRINYRGYAGQQRITNVPRTMDAQEFATFKCTRLRPTLDCSTDAALDSALTPSEYANLKAGVNTNWLDLAMRTGDQQSHDVSISGGSQDTKYFLSGGMLQVNGVARNDQFERYNFRVNLTQQVRDWLSIGTSTSFTQADRGGDAANFSDAFYMNPLMRPFDESGEQLITPWLEDPFWANPLEGINVVDDDQSRRIFSSNFIQVTVPRVTGLSYRFNGGIDLFDRAIGQYHGRNTRTGANLLGRAVVVDQQRRDWTAEHILRYDRTLGSHRLDLTTLYSVGSNHFAQERVRSEGFPNDVLTYRQANVAALVVPSDSLVESKLVSQMARLNYAFDDRYIVTATVRRDGYSGFGDNNKYGVFPSIGLGWNVSNESFWAPIGETVNNLRVRASYGASGNQAVTPYRTLAQLDDYSYIEDGATAPGYRPITLGTPDLRWETTNSANLGIDFGILEDRIAGTVDMYASRTRDLLLQRTISPTHGIGTVTQNIGKTKNRGIEVSVSSVNLQRGTFSWRSTLNAQANRNEIVDLYGDGQSDVSNSARPWIIGEPIRTQYGHEFAGIWQVGQETEAAVYGARPGDVRVRDVNGDGRINGDDRVVLGNLEPDYIAGLTNTLAWRGFELSGYLYTVQGLVRANDLLASNQVQAGVRRNTLSLEYWTPENPIDGYPANREGSNPLALAFYEDASFVRLRDLSLGYTVPSGFAKRAGFDNLKVYVNGRNLWTGTNWSGLDPELDAQRAIPLEKSVIIGLNAGF